jgi:hypothetical protein
MLFNLFNDTEEKRDLGKRTPEKLEEVQATYAKWNNRMKDPRWIRQDSTNAEVGRKLKQSARTRNQSIQQRLTRIFENDQNKDGRLPRKEYDNGNFDTMDRNGNGFVTKKEATAALRHIDP